MKKFNLPAILLKEMLLLPHSEIRLEFDDNDSKNIIEISEYFHNNQILVITQNDDLEEHPQIEDFPRFGTVSKIEHKLALPNGKIRVLIKGLYRAYVHDYIQSEDNRIESIIEVPENVDIDNEKELILMRKLRHEVKDYVKQIPYISDSMLAFLKEAKNLSELTDIVAENIPITLNRKRIYLKTYNPIERMEMLLTDIYSQKQMYEVEKELENKVRKNFDKSQKDFLIKEKIDILQKELGQKDVKSEDIDKIRRQIKETTPDVIKQKIENELIRYESIPQMSPEIVGVRNYIDTLLNIPWNIYTENTLSLDEVMEKLNRSHYGLESVKERVLEYFFIQNKNISNKGPIICLVGPPGTGKTSFAFSLAKVLNKKFVKISVGGVDDSSEIIGHRRSYLGATPGRIIQGIIKAQSMNPIFLIDEIDKMVKNYKGDPSASLLDVLDSYQNNHFVDHYVDEEVDLSHVFFITTANSLEDIPYALRDRLEIIRMKGYTEYEKLEMSQEYLLPVLYDEYHIKDEIIFQKDAILKVINEYTKEAGVRDLERKLASIIRKAMIKYEKNKKNIIISEDDVSNYLKEPITNYTHYRKEHYGTVNALAYFEYMGDVIPIEVITFKGNEKIIVTGCLGDIIKESITLAISYIKGNARKFHVPFDWFEDKDIHIHVPLGAIPKDGPSAGIAFTTAILSYIQRKTIPNNIAFTGEISLTGEIYGIGSFKEKCIGAYKKGIQIIYCPKENFSEIKNFPKDLKNKIKFIPADNYIQIYEQLFQNTKERNF